MELEEVATKLMVHLQNAEVLTHLGSGEKIVRATTRRSLDAYLDVNSKSITRGEADSLRALFRRLTETVGGSVIPITGRKTQLRSHVEQFATEQRGLLAVRLASKDVPTTSSRDYGRGVDVFMDAFNAIMEVEGHVLIHRHVAMRKATFKPLAAKARLDSRTTDALMVALEAYARHRDSGGTLPMKRDYLLQLDERGQVEAFVRGAFAASNHSARSLRRKILALSEA